MARPSPAQPRPPPGQSPCQCRPAASQPLPPERRGRGRAGWQHAHTHVLGCGCAHVQGGPRPHLRSPLHRLQCQGVGGAGCARHHASRSAHSRAHCVGSGLDGAGRRLRWRGAGRRSCAQRWPPWWLQRWHPPQACPPYPPNGSSAAPGRPWQSRPVPTWRLQGPRQQAGPPSSGGGRRTRAAGRRVAPGSQRPPLQTGRPVHPAQSLRQTGAQTSLQRRWGQSAWAAGSSVPQHAQHGPHGWHVQAHP